MAQADIWRTIGSFASASIVLASCSTAESTTAIEWTPCAPAGLPCVIETPDATYTFDLPNNWNGTLLLWPDVTEAMQPDRGSLPVNDNVRDSVKSQLLEAGYALASGQRVGLSWDPDISRGLSNDTYSQFTSQVGTPQNVFVWGRGTSALMSTLTNNDWITAIAPLCGNLAGINPNFDIALDAAFGVKALLVPDLQLTGFPSEENATENYQRAMDAVKAAAENTRGDGPQRLEFIMAIADIPTKTATSSGLGREEFAAAAIENLDIVLRRSTIERFRIEQLLAGNPSSNEGVEYQSRIDDNQRDRINRGEDTRTDTFLVELASLPRVAADINARTRAMDATPLTGAVSYPTLTLHTAFDAAAIVQNNSLFYAAAATQGPDKTRLVNINVTTPPVFYPDSGTISYGAGHCNFTADSIVGAIDVLYDWAVLDKFPSKAGNQEAFGPESGYDPTYVLPPWPAGPTS